MGLGPRGLATGNWGLRDGGGRLGSEMMVPGREVRDVSAGGGGGGPGVPKMSPGCPLTEGLSALSPGIGVPLEFHVTLRLHGVHDHLEGAVELEGDLKGWGDTGRWGGGLVTTRGPRGGHVAAPHRRPGSCGDTWQQPGGTCHITGTSRSHVAVPQGQLSHRGDPKETSCGTHHTTGTPKRHVAAP